MSWKELLIYEEQGEDQEHWKQNLRIHIFHEMLN